MSQATHYAINDHMELTLTDADDFEELLSRPKCFAYPLAINALDLVLKEEYASDKMREVRLPDSKD